MHAARDAAYAATLQHVQAGDDAALPSRSVVRQWMLCVQDTLALLTRSVDLTDVCRYLPDASTMALHVADDARQRLLRAACRRQVAQHGSEPLRLRYQRCVRWTWLLLWCYCAHSSSTGHDSSDDDAAMREMYEGCVLLLAHQILPRHAMQHAYWCMRRRQMSSAQPTSSPPASSVAATDVSSHTVRPMLYAAISEATSAAATHSMPHATNEQEQAAQLRLCVYARLQAIAHGRDADGSRESSYSATDAAQQAPSTPLQPLVRAVLSTAEATPSAQHDVSEHDAQPTTHAALTAADWRAVGRALETVGYVVLTKVSFGQCESGYDVLPFLVDFALLAERCKGAQSCAPTADAAHACSLLTTLYAALLAALRVQYDRAIATAVHTPITTTTAAAPPQRCAQDGSASHALHVAPVVLEVLTSTVEPTLRTLRLCTRGRGTSVSRDVLSVLQEALASDAQAKSNASRSKHAASSPRLDAQSLCVANDRSDATLTTPEHELVTQVKTHVPPTFTALTQLLRAMPQAVRTALPNEQTFAAFLLRHPGCFSVSTIGAVTVARGAGARDAAFLVRESARRRRQCALAASGTAPLAVGAGCASRRRSDVPQVVRDTFPSFLVPVRALWSSDGDSDTAHDGTGTATAQRKAQVLRLMREYRDMLFRVQPACSNADDLEHSLVALSAARGTGTTTRDEESVADARYAEWRVAPYEWYRVARLLPRVDEWVAVTPTLRHQARLLLPAGHELLHVTLTAPHLFTVRVAAAPSVHTTQADASGNDAASPQHELRFLLDSCFAPHIEADREELQARLDALYLRETPAGAAVATRLAVPLHRRRQRALRRQLSFLTAPSPFFDERVLAQLLLDTLPTTGAVRANALLRALPPPARACLPRDASALLKRHPHLFALDTDDSALDFAVRRADVPADAGADTARLSASTEAILQELYNRYPRTADPAHGTCVFRCLVKLPLRVREALFALDNVEEQLLRRYPDKVELLPGSVRLVAACPDPRDLFSVTAAQLQRCRGRMDFFVPFRFVGEWRQRLTRRHRPSRHDVRRQ